MTTETVKLYIVRTYRGMVPNDYHSTGIIEAARYIAGVVRDSAYPPDRVEIIEQTTTIAERVVE